MEYPEKFRGDVDEAIRILKEAGASEIYIFGSLVDEEKKEWAGDLDMAVRGIPKSKFFDVLGILLTSLDHSIDLVCLDYETSFSKLLIEKGKLLRVA